MRMGSACSGIEAASLAWNPIGIETAWVAENDRFPSAVLSHRYPGVPNLGDITTVHAETLKTYGTIDILMGGTPCQSFSLAGLREGLRDPRGQVVFGYLRLAQILKPRWVVWENVPGVLSVDEGRAFGAFLGGLEKLGYGWSYRTLDAQYFGVPQRRRRIFVVAYLGDWRRPAAVLFEPESLRGDTSPGGEAGEIVAALTSRGVGTCGADDNQAQAGHLIPHLARTIRARGQGDHDSDYPDTLIPSVAYAVRTQDRRAGQGWNSTLIPAGQQGPGDLLARGNRGDLDTETMITHTLKGEGHDGSEDGTGRGVPLVACTLQASNGGASSGYHPVIESATPREPTGVRRLTPRECERLQGLPDDWTLVPYGPRSKPAKDGPRYKAVGNSIAVPVLRWIGERIQMVDAL